MRSVLIALGGLVTMAAFAQDTTRTYHAPAVVVTGSRLEVARQSLPLTVSVVPEDEIDRSRTEQLLSLVARRVPGMFVTERGVTGYGVATGSAGQISMRGIGGNPTTQVLMLIDGAPQIMGLMGHHLPDAYAASDAQRVEVVRGPASVLYGSNAMGGVVNIITRKQASPGFSGSVSALAGSYGTQKYSARGGWSGDRVTTTASVNHDRTDGHRRGSSFSMNNGYLSARIPIDDRWTVSGDANLALYKSFDPGPDTLAVSFTDHWVDIRRGKASLKVENRHDGLKGAAHLFVNYGVHKIYDGFESNDRDLGLMLYQGITLGSANLLTVGVDVKSYGGAADNPRLPAPARATLFSTRKDFSVSELAAYATVQHSFSPQLIVSGGLRANRHSLYGTEMVPQAGASYALSEATTARASVSRGYRSPAIRELYLFPPKNPDLQPERMWNYEAGASHTMFDGQLSIEATLFLAEGENLIKPSGVPPNVRNINTGAFTHRGIELEAGLSLENGLSVRSLYSYLSVNTPVTAAPEHDLFLEGSMPLGPVAVSANVRVVSGLTTLVAPRRSASYTLLGLEASSRVTSAVELFANLENLLDERYEINAFYPMPGRTIMGGIRVGL
ncbi:MAG: TonB-dependent receptor [Bacteroidetes bacterium]|jgi:iron complex outermembrane receptor protein|nr:TonB-dependent receptor [Bacteroidota bacterium]